MYIQSLKLENFQKHKDLQINFVNGVNVLYGSSDAGKSCIRRAIEWLVQNENIDGIRKTGTKKTSVAITLGNDIEVERIKSQSINRYIIRKDKDEKIYDAVGRGIPDEVKEVLNIYPIEVDGEEIYLNSYPQIGLPFLFDKSPSFRMKLFNKLTGNDVLDKLFGDFNKDILRIKRATKEESERFENRIEELKIKKVEKEKAEALHTRIKKRIIHIKELHIKYSKLLELKELQEKNTEEYKVVAKSVKNLHFPQPEVIQQLTSKIDQFTKLHAHKNALEKAKIGLDRVGGQLKDLKPLSIDSGSLRGKIERFDTLKTLHSSLDTKQKTCYTLKEDIKHLKIDLKDIEQNYKKILKECKICPMCNKEI